MNNNVNVVYVCTVPIVLMVAAFFFFFRGIFFENCFQYAKMNKIYYRYLCSYFLWESKLHREGNINLIVGNVNKKKT